MIIAGIFSKLFPTEHGKVESIFENLTAIGYKKVASSDAALLNAIRQLKPMGGGLFAVKSAVVMRRGEGLRHISDLHLKMHVNQGASDLAEWTIITQTQPLGIGASKSITPRTVAYEMLFKRAQLQEEITIGVSEEFASLFYAFTKSKESVWVPEPIQTAIVSLATSFPFKALEQSIAIAYFSPKGWSILCDRVKNATLFNDLLRVADRIEEAVAKTTSP